jgi:hypothetical protein
MTTAELAAEIKRLAHANPALADIIRPLAVRFADRIAEKLPDIDPADIAAVVIHTSCYVTDAQRLFREGGTSEGQAAVNAVNITAMGGELMHRRAQRASGGSQ